MIDRTPSKRIGHVGHRRRNRPSGVTSLGYVTGRVLDIDGLVRRSDPDVNIPDLR